MALDQDYHEDFIIEGNTANVATWFMDPPPPPECVVAQIMDSRSEIQLSFSCIAPNVPRLSN